MKGRDLTPSERRRILQLAAQSNGDMDFVLSARQIGKRLGLSERSVFRAIRFGAKRYSELIARDPTLE